MLPNTAKPFLVRAIYEWCLDQGYTPHIMVRVDEHCRVPRAHVRDNHIVLNVGPRATPDFFMDNEWVSFNARFSGVSQLVSFPITAIAWVFARETEEGMGFEVTEYKGNPSADDSSTTEETDKLAQKTTPFRLVD
ncbi:ClpXP protease specificity-enhancing factor [Pelistega suis]|uniref:ClpXP protease specificity-enhancing factor n=1 Tax=Pelistega suis TaxID=1631957 RepID=UPI00211C8F06|nr:ClpXP protease specificity-enhancing factor [Pelistega suis]MCQ9329295.1 ClpXP protease specificity-enhancing factor [Pelistega suis]